ncbi:MAG TPA: hypothetical protein VEC06_04675, partial [Paucimonas sp.]|nr:hypothetical protein [Paucimonas sp.]
MNPNLVRNLKDISSSTITWLGRAFDAIADWVTQLSWRKFILFAIVVMIAGSLMNDALFEQHVVVVGKKTDRHRDHAKSFADGETDIQIDSTGIHIRKTPRAAPENDEQRSAGDKDTAPL